MMVGSVVVVATAAVIGRDASSDDCVYGHTCSEETKDGRGCCPAPPADAAAKQAEEDRRAAEKKRAEAKAAEDARRAAGKKKTGAKAAEGVRQAGNTKAAAEAGRPADGSTGGVPPSKTCPVDMVHVPGGTFWMGSPTGLGELDEHPQHQVTLSGYCIDRTEVTVAAYARCAASRKCTSAMEPATKGQESLCNGTRADRQDHPVNCVDWDQARTYCGFVNKRLPSEAEWEYAARGSDGRMYSWGNEPPSAKRLNACDRECRALGKRMGEEWPITMYDDSDGWETTAPVGSFPAGASPFGALDMTGNVWEWTADWYGRYQAGASTNPPRDKDGWARVLRGGGWDSSDAGKLRTASRGRVGPALRDADLGFRCARAD